MRSAIAVIVVLLAGLAGCSSTQTESAPTISVDAAPSASSADIAFAQSMIPHHAQAVAMADLALLPQADASTQVQQLAEQIKAAQGPEIAQMSQWLQEWGAPSAMPGGDHSGHDMGGVTSSGMMSAKQMKQLAAASGEEFDTLWLEMMIEHHTGAIEMAGQVRAGSTSPQVQGLADEIITAQEQEISEMEQLIAQGQ